MCAGACEITRYSEVVNERAVARAICLPKHSASRAFWLRAPSGSARLAEWSQQVFTKDPLDQDTAANGLQQSADYANPIDRRQNHSMDKNASNRPSSHHRLQSGVLLILSGPT